MLAASRLSSDLLVKLCIFPVFTIHITRACDCLLKFRKDSFETIVLGSF